MDELLECVGEAVGGVLGQERMLDPHYFSETLRRGFCGKRLGLRADEDRIRLNVELRCQLLGCSNRLPTDASDATRALFNYNPYAAHSTRTSNFSFSTRVAAASFAVPGRIWVNLCFCGNVIRSNTTTGALSISNSAAVMRRTSLVFARLMPISVA